MRFLGATEGATGVLPGATEGLIVGELSVERPNRKPIGPSLGVWSRPNVPRADFIDDS